MTRSWGPSATVGCGGTPRWMRGSTRRSCLKPAEVWPEDHDKSTKNSPLDVRRTQFDGVVLPGAPGSRPALPATATTARYPAGFGPIVRCSIERRPGENHGQFE